MRRAWGGWKAEQQEFASPFATEEDCLVLEMAELVPLSQSVCGEAYHTHTAL